MSMEASKHRTGAELEAGLDDIRGAPKRNGSLVLIVRRPQTGVREVLAEGELSLEEGLVGDNWRTRGRSTTRDKSANPDAQITVMSSRAVALFAPERDRWALAGDQLYVDLDLSAENLPAGTRLTIGSAVIEVTAVPHTGCKKFVERFGLEAMKLANSSLGRELRLRGINTRVVQPGTFRVGDVVEARPPLESSPGSPS
jgi:MOSC domain-containing protein YiiM